MRVQVDETGADDAPSCIEDLSPARHFDGTADGDDPTVDDEDVGTDGFERAVGEDGATADG